MTPVTGKSNPHQQSCLYIMKVMPISILSACCHWLHLVFFLILNLIKTPGYERQ